MKKFLFEGVTRHTYALIWVSDRFFSIPAAVLLWLGQAARFSVANFGYFFMSKIDPLRCKIAEAENDTDPDELKLQSLELKLMQSSYKVRDHAKESGDWTDHHTEAIEAIGNALYEELGWSEEAVTSHLKSVVESIDGLEMDSWLEDED